ncbi:MAG TPA: MoaD/ThiS family protein [Syntrophorhabdaceae bacterium]|nr:MoaD/ThiS family protein [Syntrophorhabdaceae bacterium]HPU29039.1 MoaD/ThiS family protein [Syntrophorhabdaceae bacterium]
MKVEFNGKSIEIKKVSTVSKLLEELAINRETHLVIVNNRLVTEDYRFNQDDKAKIIKVVSGG